MENRYEQESICGCGGRSSVAGDVLWYGTGTVTGNTGAYVLFSNLTDSAKTIDIVGSGTVAGIQIVSAVPEPASLGLLAVSATGLLIRRRQA